MQMPEPNPDNHGAAGRDSSKCDQSSVLTTYSGRVLPGWVDANGHMNVSFYDRVFDEAEHDMFASFGIHDDYIHRTGLTIFRLDKLIRYERELMEGDAIAVHSRVIWTDFRRVHAFHEMMNVDASYRAATKDAISIHVDLSQRRSVTIALPEVRGPLERLAAAHAALPAPAGAVGREETWRSRR